MAWELIVSDEEDRFLRDLAARRLKFHNEVSGRAGDAQDDLQRHLEGVAGEYAVHKLTGLAWTGMIQETVEEFEKHRRSGHDVGPLEVKSTSNPNGPLILKQYERFQPDTPYVLVRVHQYPTLKVIGWAYGREIDKKIWHVERPFYTLDNDELRSMDNPDFKQYIDWWTARVNPTSNESRPARSV